MASTQRKRYACLNVDAVLPCRCATLLAMIPSSGSKMVESNVRRVLPVLAVFADWCCLHPRYLGCSSLGRDGKSNKRGKASDGARGGERDRDERERVVSAESVRASEKMLRSEEEARSSMKSCITFLESFVKASMSSQAGDAARSALLVRVIPYMTAVLRQCSTN